MYNTSELREHIDDLYSLQKLINKALDCADDIGDHDEDEVLGELTKQIEGMAIALGITQKIREEFFSFVKKNNLELRTK